MTDKYGFSDLERKIVMDQIDRRARLRKEYLKLRTDPCKHSMQSGYVFDPAIQRYLSMKATLLEHFEANPGSIKMAMITFIPMALFGYLLYTDRAKKEKLIRCGILKYKDRLFKFA